MDNKSLQLYEQRRKQKLKLHLIDMDRLDKLNREEGMSINMMAEVLEIPYATLYRAIKGRDPENQDLSANGPQPNEVVGGSEKS